VADRATLVRLRQEVGRDLTSAERLLDDLRARAPALGSTADPVLLGYVAVTLHQVYTALEASFERICRALEGSLPAGPDAHQALLLDMALELPGIRPAVLREGTVLALRPLLRFRHFVRHTYAITWDARRMTENVELAHRAWPEVRADVESFLRFLDETAAVLAQ
jgi:hypothetical protein